MRTIKLMADYDCWPLWELKPAGLDNIDPKRLPISDGLAEDLIKWSGDFDAILNKDDPVNSGFSSSKAQDEWKSRGASLADRLRSELGGRFQIVERI